MKLFTFDKETENNTNGSVFNLEEIRQVDFYDDVELLVIHIIWKDGSDTRLPFGLKEDYNQSKINFCKYLRSQENGLVIL